MKNLSAVLFDLDGTLADTAPDFHRIINLVLAKRKIPPVDYSVIRPAASNGGLAMIKETLSKIQIELEPEPLHAEFLEIYAQSPIQTGGLFSGIELLLELLSERDISWGVVTNKPRRFTEKVIQELGLTESCQVLICPEDVSKAKPNPEGLLTAARLLNQQPDSCLYIGDHQRDIVAGKAAGMPTIACGFGYISEQDSAKDWDADYCVASTSELRELVAELLKTQQNN